MSAFKQIFHLGFVAFVLITNERVSGYDDNEINSDFLQLDRLNKHFQIHGDDDFHSQEDPKEQFRERETEYFDLTYTYNNDTVFYPFQRWPEFILLKDTGPVVNITGDGKRRYTFSQWSFCMSEHGGTHIDAPFHFNKFGWKLHEIPLKRLVNVPAIVVDVEELVFSHINPNKFLLQVEHLRDHESKFGRIPFGSVILVRFGWSKFWLDKIRYMGWDNSTAPFGGRPTLNFPEISRDAANWLIRERGIYGVGTDTLSPDTSEVNPYVHIMLLENQVYILENVANLDYLLHMLRPHNHHHHCKDIRMHVLPMKTEGTGGPVRLVAYCDKW